MIEIKRLNHFDAGDAQRLIAGYISHARYRAERTETADAIALMLHLLPLPAPYVKQYDPMDAETLARYGRLPEQGFSFAAYDENACVGIALAELQRWNNSLWVWEFHIAASHQGQGVGRRLMAAVVDRARAAGVRAVMCETQNTNVPAIAFYRKLGFTVDGIDLSYYSNEDYPDGEIAIFMKKYLAVAS